MGAIRELNNELRKRGIVVHEWPGWDGRGNEGVKQIDPKGGIIHHTGSGYGSTYQELVTSTQAWAKGGTLCNYGGNSDGSLTTVASGIGWHAGTGAGPSLGKLAPWRNRLNYYAVGLEVVYPGSKPMLPSQYHTACVFADCVADLFGEGDIECVRGHGETNGRGGDGKWDPGWAMINSSGQMIDMNQFRRDAKASGNTNGGDMGLTPAERAIIDTMAANVARINAFLSISKDSPVGPDGKPGTLFDEIWDAAAAEKLRDSANLKIIVDKLNAMGSGASGSLTKADVSQALREQMRTMTLVSRPTFTDGQ